MSPPPTDHNPHDGGQGRPASSPKRDGEFLSNRSATVIIYVVTAIWAFNIVAGMFTFTGWQPSSEVNGAFMLIVGGAFVARARSKGGEQ